MSDKSVDKTIVVLNRVEPLAGHFAELQKISEEWFEFLKKSPDFKGVSVICSVDQQIAWLEEWTSRVAVDKFTDEHIAYADFSTRILNCSRGMATRHVYRRLA